MLRTFFLMALSLSILLPATSYSEFNDDHFYASPNDYSENSYDRTSEDDSSDDNNQHSNYYPDYQNEFPIPGNAYPDEEVYEASPDTRRPAVKNFSYVDDSRLPHRIRPPGEKLILINPHVHAWGAYLADGTLIRSGLATAGANWCSDTRRPCRTKVGSFRIFTLGGSECVSSLYPLGEGGAPMPYCMFFNGNQGIHGSNAVAPANMSHGCVRVSVSDAAWIRFNFANKGTKVVVEPY